MTNSKKLTNMLGIEYLSKEQIQDILTNAKKIKENHKTNQSHTVTLKGKIIAQLFFEPSTRTRLAFEIAIKRLGAEVMNIDIKHSSVQKGESLKDTIQNIEALGVDGFIIRHHETGATKRISQYVNVPIINAGDGENEHPTQALLDIFTMTEHLGNLEEKNILIWGDIKHSRVAKSNIYALQKMNANIFLGGPENLIPKQYKHCKIIDNFEENIGNMHVLNVLRIQYERGKEDIFPTPQSFCKKYGITTDRLKNASENLIVMHPGPVNRGVEMSSEVLDTRCIALTQVKNGVYVRMAILNKLFSH